MTPEFTAMPPHLATALEPIDRDLRALLERVVTVSFAAAEAHAPGTGHAASLSSLMAFATVTGMQAASRALEIHDDKPPRVVVDVITRNIQESTLMTVDRLVADIAERQK